jgi:hypothetical protein
MKSANQDMCRVVDATKIDETLPTCKASIYCAEVFWDYQKNYAS